mgnify:FL=1
MEMQVKFNFDGKESNLKCTVALDGNNHLVCRTKSPQLRREFVTKHFDELTQEKIWPDDNYPDELYGAKVLLKNFISDFEGTLKKYDYNPNMMDFANEIQYYDHIVNSDNPEFHKHLMKLSAFYHEITSMLEYYTHKVIDLAGLSYKKELIGLPFAIRNFKPAQTLEALSENSSEYQKGLSNIYFLKELIDTFSYRPEEYDLIPFLEEHRHCTKSDIHELITFVEFMNKVCTYWDGMTIQIMNYSKIRDKQIDKEIKESKSTKKPVEFTNPNYKSVISEFERSNPVAERGVYINKDLKIWWARNPDYKDVKNGEVVDVNECPIIDYNGDRVACNLKYKGTDEKRNVWYSRDCQNWYRQIDLPLNDRENGIEDIFRVEKEPKLEKIRAVNPIKVEESKPIKREKIYLSRRIGTQEKYIIPTKMVTGQILNWIYQQDPINPKTNAPVHEKFINGLMLTTTKYLIDKSNRDIPDFDYLDMSEKEFIDLLSDLIFNNESTRDWYMALNISYAEAKAGVTVQDRYNGTDAEKISFVSRFNTIPWENNFIDICALGQNVVVSVISEVDKENLMKLHKDGTAIPNKTAND